MLDPQASRFGQAAVLSGLMDVEGLTACWNAIPPEKREAPEHIDRRLARQAVQSHALTLWQAQQLLAGRTSGFKVDRYVLLELIGQGGMGRVYLARDTRLNRRVALKILAPERISNPRAVARFQREARVGAQLQHENLVRIYDFGESGGRFFLVMEFIEGKTIGYLISEQGPMPPATAARLVRQVALGLGHAHRKGLIHRDVNPYNIMVTHDGVAKLADLGLAIDLTEGDRVTREGATVGTFDYVAPEQARHSHAADIRSDIYSLGCTMYHMLSGQVPFPSPSLPEKLFAHQAMEATPLEQLVPGLPAGLADVVRTMMRKSPDERYATPAQVVQAFESYLDEPAADGRRADVVRPFPGLDGAPSPGSDVDAGGGPVLSSGARNASVSPPVSSPLPDSSPKGSTSASPQPDEGGVLAAAGNGAEKASVAMRSTAAVSNATGAGTGTPRSSGLASTAPADLDDPSIPLITPMDDDDEEDGGVLIHLDLGPEPPLRPVTTRPRSRLSGVFSRGAKPAPASDGDASLAPTLKPARPSWRPPPGWIQAAVVAAILVMVLLVLLGFAGKLRWPWKRPSVPTVERRDSSETGGEDGNLAGSPQPSPIRAESGFVVRSVGGQNVDDDREAPLGGLKDAARAAMGMRGGYVELRNSEPLDVDLDQFIDQANGRGTLDLRAAPGMQPVINIRMSASKPFLSAGSAVGLSITGVTFRVGYPRNAGAMPPARPAVIQSAGRVQIERCAFEVVNDTRPEDCRAIDVKGGNLVVDRCWFQGFDRAIRFEAHKDSVAKIMQTMIVSAREPASVQPATHKPRGWAVALELIPLGEAKPGDPNPKRQLLLDHCTIDGAGVLDLTGTAGLSPFTAAIDRCAVRTDTVLAWNRQKTDDSIAATLRWQGERNQLDIVGNSWVVLSSVTNTPALALGVTDLESWSKFVTRENDPIRARIHYRTEPAARPSSPRPHDFEIEPAGSADMTAGADPELVGPWGK